MSRVAEIIEHEKAADGDEAAIEEHRWAAARLIWEELEGGTTKTELAERIGKSRTHVLFASRCWDLVRDSGYVTMPRYSDLYHSDDVRADRNPPVIEQPAKAGGQGSRRTGDAVAGDEPPSPRDAATAWVSQACEGIELLETYRVAWAFLLPADIERLAGLPNRIEALLTDLKANVVS